MFDIASIHEAGLTSSMNWLVRQGQKTGSISARRAWRASLLFVPVRQASLMSACWVLTFCIYKAFMQFVWRAR